MTRIDRNRNVDGREPRRERDAAGKPVGRPPLGTFHSQRGRERSRARGSSARDVAVRALGDVVQSDAFASQALNRHLVEAGLKENDRRLATGLFYSALENRLYIGHILDRFVERRPEPRINDVLHIAVAQLLFMDRVPDHAAVDEAVGQVRNMHLEGYAGMVNGVLRNVIRARDAGALNLTDLEADPIAWLSVRYSLALPAAKRLVEAYGFEEAKSIAAWTPVRREQSIRANRERMDAASFEAWLESQKFNWRKGAVTGAYIVTDGGDLSTHAGYRQGLFSIQGQSAMLAGMAVEAKPGMQILDACAAPGGKTCLMAEQMGTSGRVYAWDIYPHRVALIRAAARRLGLENVRPVERDARKPMESMDLTMDAVLVDAPCSGLGMIAEKPDIKYRQTDEGLKDLPRLQRQILEAASRAVKIGGTLVYATCTVLPEENEQVVRAFLEAHSEFEPLPGGDWLPKTLLPRLSEGMLQILPHRDGLEGFFIARMYRKGM